MIIRRAEAADMGEILSIQKMAYISEAKFTMITQFFLLFKPKMKLKKSSKIMFSLKPLLKTR